MPSQTFLNLPPEKRERFMKAAIQEFSRVPFSEASINQIIRASDIARGSFYMYFEDKQDLFTYIINDFLEAFVQQIIDEIDANKGDIFDALLHLYHRGIKFSASNQQRDILNILHINREMRIERLLERLPWKNTLNKIVEHLDRSMLRFDTDVECALMVITLFKVTLPYFFDKHPFFIQEDKEQSYENSLNILKYGVIAQS